MLRGYLILKTQKIMFFKSIILNIDLTKKNVFKLSFKKSAANSVPNTKHQILESFKKEKTVRLTKIAD